MKIYPNGTFPMLLRNTKIENIFFMNYNHVETIMDTIRLAR